MTATETSGRVIQVGDFFEESWGYDQTNVDFYQVVRVSSSGKTVWLRRVRSELVEAREYTDLLAPVVDGFRDDGANENGNSRGGMLKRSLRWYDHGNGRTCSVNMTSYSNAYLWDGKPCSQTGAQYGH